MGASERPEREGRRGQQAVGERGDELEGMHRRLKRQRHERTQHAREPERQGGAQREADRDPDRGQHHHLGEVDREHARPGGAERFQRRDHVALAVEIVLGRVGDADPADQQRGEADEREILGEALDVALELRRRVAAGPDVPAGIGQPPGGLLHRALDRGLARAGGKPDAIMPPHQAAGLQQAGRAQGRLAHHQARPESDAAGELVGLGGEARPDVERRIADREPDAGRKIQSREQRRVGDGAEFLAAPRQQIGQRRRRIARDRSVERIGAVHRLDLDQGRASVGGARHCAQRGRDRNVAQAVQEGALLGRRLALDQREGEIAAQYRAALAREPVDQALGERADARDRRHAERDAGDEHPEAAHAAAQFAQREAQREPAHGRGKRGGGHAVTARASAWSDGAENARARKAAPATGRSVRPPRRRAASIAAQPYRSCPRRN